MIRMATAVDIVVLSATLVIVSSLAACLGGR